MTTIRAITFATIFLSTTAGTTLAQGMLDVLRQQQEQFEQEIQELEQLGSSIDDYQKLKLQELKMKHENNQEMINTYSAK